MGNAGLKQRIIQSGKVTIVDKVTRGALLCYDKDEWMKRARVVQRDMEIGTVLMIFVAFFNMILEIWRWFFGVPFLESNNFIFPLIWAIMLILFIWTTHAMRKRNRYPVAVPGIYENGVQLPNDHTFVPYAEIRMVEWEFLPLFSFKKKVYIRLRSKFAKKPGSITDGWSIPVEYLGPEGMTILRDRMEMAREPEDA